MHGWLPVCGSLELNEGYRWSYLRGLTLSNGRVYDDLPNEMRRLFRDVLATLLESKELMCAFGFVINELLHETDELWELAAKIEPQLRKLMVAWDK